MFLYLSLVFLKNCQLCFDFFCRFGFYGDFLVDVRRKEGFGACYRRVRRGCCGLLRSDEDLLLNQAVHQGLDSEGCLYGCRQFLLLTLSFDILARNE